MPPSPASKCSLGREHRMESTPKMGWSCERGAPLRAKDDDLALFNDMQNKERDNFLLHGPDDVNDSLSKLRYLPYYKLDITIPVRGERSDLLNIEGEKNDYDWLLTPPDTPLFRSLDDDGPQPLHLLPRGRPRSQPIKVSRSLSSMTENTHTMSRSSGSPRRLSPSPRSSTSVTQLKRPSSAPRASPPPASRPATPSRRPSTPYKPSSPTPRSSTPTLRRTSTGSTGQAASSGRRPTSPMNSSHGNSASPKLRGWQTDLPGFSSDAPPNLRTSQSDRSVLHVGGMSPAPRSGRGRQSVSPIASRSAGSSHSHERDHISSFSKGSILSSGDDDMDSMHSVTISSSPVRRNGISANNRTMAYSKKASRTSSASSVPKRAFDSVLRQMENHRTTQNMFRPLLSSVPATTFYVGKADSSHQPMFSRNSSLTTSTSASSDQGASVAPDMEGSELDQNDLPGDWERTGDPNTHEGMFIFDKEDGILEDCGHEDSAGMPHSGCRSFTESVTNKLNSQECTRSMVHSVETASNATSLYPSCATCYCVAVDGCEIMAICSKCGKHFQLVGLNGDTNICEECAKIDQLFAVEPLIPITEDVRIKSDSKMGADRLCNEVEASANLESPEKSSNEGQHQWDTQQGPNCLDGNHPVHLVTDHTELHLSNQPDNHVEDSVAQSDSESKLGQMEYTANPIVRVGNSEGRGISVLLQRPGSSKWPVIQGRAFSATNVFCSEPSYVINGTSSLRHHVGRDSASASSSTDLDSYRQSEVHVQRQFSSRKNEMCSTRSDTDANAQCTGSHPDLMVGTHEPLFHPTSEIEDYCNDSSKSMEYDALRESVKDTNEHANFFDHANMSGKNNSYIRLDLNDDAFYVIDHRCLRPNTYDTPLHDHPESTHDYSAADSLKDKSCFAIINADGDPLRANERSTHDVEAPIDPPDTSVIKEQYVTNDPTCCSDISDTATDSHYVILESQNGRDIFQAPQTECIHSHIPTKMEVPNGYADSATSEKGASDCTSESCIIDHARGIHEESTVILEGPRGHASRSLTLAEATDCILFCSSIVHDIAYKAASIAMEKESTMQPEISRPTATITGKSVLDEKDSRTPNENVLKFKKSRRKKMETQTKAQPTESGEDVILLLSAPSDPEIPSKAIDSTKPPKLESKCNCTVM